ncbi:MAG: ferrous iron transport protein B [Nitrospiraceae bacterium]|nr:ferrous iron transport protein B [Nitrospiraceae bacterium]
MVVAFAGNPNVGKTALINSLSGANLKVGNWPGVTVEKKEADMTFEGRKVKLIDLPGIYSLSPYTLEERIARDFILEGKPDVIVNANIERNLYLTTQLLELGIPVVIALNIWDDFRSMGYRLDLEMFQELLNVKAVPTVATRNEGNYELMKLVVNAADSGKAPRPLEFSESIEKFIEKVEEKLPKELPYPRRWTAIKVLERDSYLAKKMDLTPYNLIADEFEKTFGNDGETVIADERYGIISGLLKRTLKQPLTKVRSWTDVADMVILNRVLGIPIFLFLMYLAFKFSFDGSGPFIDWTDGFVNGFIAKWVGKAIAWSPNWFQSLTINGIIGGVGLVLTFAPLMFFIYFFLALLEESGYMARAAFVMDKIMHGIGLHGKSFIPLIIGFGCNVPAIYATRVLENERDRKLTALLVPFMSCGARLPIYALFTGVFFASHQASVVLLMYVIGVVVAVIVGLILKSTVFKGKTPPFILELPPYRVPTVRAVWQSMWNRTKFFLIKAGTVIAATMIILWGFLNLPYGVTPDKTYLGRFAKTIAPIFKPCGFPKWQPVAALVPGTIAKEAVIGSLGQFYGVGGEEEGGISENSTFMQDLADQVKGFVGATKDSFVGMFGSLKTGVFEIEHEKTPLQKKIEKDFTSLSAFSYMVFCLLWIPCIVTIGAMYSEFGWGMVGLSILLTTIVPYLMSTLIYQFGRLLGY